MFRCVASKKAFVSASASCSSSRVLVRGFRTSITRLNDKKPEPIPITPTPPMGSTTTPVAPKVDSSDDGEGSQGKKKGFSFTKFLFTALLLAGTGYLGTLYAATKHDAVMDFVIDQQLPYYEEIIDFMEKGSLEDVQASFNKLVHQVSSMEFKLPSKDQINELTSKGEKIFEETKSKLSTSSSGSGATKDVAELSTTADATPAQQLQKPVETVQKAVEHLPLIKLNKGIGSSVDDSVNSTIDSFNDLIRSIDIGTQNTAGKESLIRNINESISKLANKLNSLTSSFDEEVQSKLKISQTELLSSFTKKELELTETLLDQFNREKTQLEQRLNERLKHEIEATKQTISQAAVNAVTMMRIEQTKNFEKLVKGKIDQERDGRLADLDKLNERLNELEEFSVNLENQLVANHNKSVLLKAIINLKHALSASSEIDQPKLLIQYFDKINQLSSAFDNELITLALKDLHPLIANESTHSVLTKSQLINKWDDLTPELRSASLLPPNPGLLGHFASMVFSKLLLPVKGSKPDGKDIESVIGRIDTALTKGDLDIAVEEAANLKGWPRRLADDWVKEARKRLEVQFLVDVLESESRIV